MKLLPRLLLASLSLVVSFQLISPANAAPALIPSAPKLAATGYILMDADSGEVLVEKNADERLPPASLTKMMTSYVLSYELAQGNVHNDDMVTVSKKAWAQNPIFNGSSLMWIEVGTQVKLSDLHKGIVISSGNDATVAVAEYLAGSENAFAEMMNQHAEMLGMTNTHYMNSHGLPHKDHYSSAADLAKLAKALIVEFPEDYGLYKEKEFTYNGIKQLNRNTLLWRDPSVDGLKTGHTQAAGYCLVASAKKNGMRLISVVMGTKSEAARLRETQKLLTYGFRYFETHKLYSGGDVLNNATLWRGDADNVALGINDDVYITIPRGQHDNIKAELQIDPFIKAPLSKGQELGAVVVRLGDETLLETPLYAMEDAPEAGFLSRLWDDIRLFFYKLWHEKVG